MKKQDFHKFLKCLMKAMQNIDSHYFQLNFAGSDELKYRERVYCYELYHQLRLLLGDDFPYKLDGELDKKSHSIILGEEKPDFIIHVPGEMEQNLVVIEVKTLVAVKGDMNKLGNDFRKLKRFISKEAKYYRAIMLIYGSVNGDLPQNIRQEIEKVHDEKIIILWHDSPNKKPKIIGGERYID